MTSDSHSLKHGTKQVLSQEIKDKVNSAMCLVYECGENRDDVMDNLVTSVNHLLDDSNVSEYYEYVWSIESGYLNRQ